MANNRFPVYAGVYANSTSWHRQGSPTPEILKAALKLGCKYSDGAVAWQLPLTGDPAKNPMLAVVREFTTGGGDALADKCGQGVN
jgi:hypothetical protein